ncbi:hypothetical protein GF354_05290 [Candidatus Peregrinibacteria bacterium]|nr:hypothetical protein [Candidatus Peregrinibacteria bacterium]
MVKKIMLMVLFTSLIINSINTVYADELADEEEILEQYEGVVCNEYLTKYIRFGWNNDDSEVLKLQEFLNDYLGKSLILNGHYNLETFAAVKEFQGIFKEEILSPWGLEEPTGFVYITTKRKVNNLYCPEANIPIPSPLEIHDGYPLAPR